MSAALCLCAVVAFAQQPPQPDYSREALLRMLAPPLAEKRPPGRVQWHRGYVEVRALGMNWRFFIPLAAPFHGARLGDGAVLPNPFELTGTRYASTMPPMFDNDRSWEVEREYRRIQRMTTKEQRLKEDR